MLGRKPGTVVAPKMWLTAKKAASKLYVGLNAGIEC